MKDSDKDNSFIVHGIDFVATAILAIITATTGNAITGALTIVGLFAPKIVTSLNKDITFKTAGKDKRDAHKVYTTCNKLMSNINEALKSETDKDKIKMLNDQKATIQRIINAAEGKIEKVALTEKEIAKRKDAIKLAKKIFPGYLSQVRNEFGIKKNALCMYNNKEEEESFISGESNSFSIVSRDAWEQGGNPRQDDTILQDINDAECKLLNLVKPQLSKAGLRADDSDDWDDGYIDISFM